MNMENSHIELTSTWACSTVFTGLFLYDAVMNCPEITITASARLYTIQDMLIFLLSIQYDIKINKTAPLFTLGSIYSVNASGDGQMHETNNLNQIEQG